MKKLLIIAIAAGSFFAGSLYPNLIDNRCLMQNVTLDKTLSLVGKDNCYITNVKFEMSDMALEIK